MGISTLGTPYLVGSVSGSGVSTSVISVGNAGNATGYTGSPTKAGDLIAVCCDSDQTPFTPNISGITDSAGNTYTQITSLGGGTGTGNPEMEVWAAYNTSPLTTTNTITVTWSGGASDVNATAIGCSGLAAAGAPDQVKGTSALVTGSTASLATGNLGLAVELAVVFASARQVNGQPVIAAPFTPLATFQGAANTHFDAISARTVTTADPITTTATTPSSGTSPGWRMILVTFRAAVNLTAGGQCGGSALAFPIVTRQLTATGNCGGSYLGPAEQAPLPPPAEPVFPAGYGPVAADMQAWVRASLGYCTQNIVFRAEKTTGQSLTGGTYAALAYNSVTEDPFGGWSATSTGSQAANSWLAPWTGVYRVTFGYTVAAVAGWQAASIGLTGVNPSQDGTQVPSPASFPGGAGGSFLVPMIGGSDYMQFLARSSVNATTSTGVGLRPYVEVTATEADLRG